MVNPWAKQVIFIFQTRIKILFQVYNIHYLFQME